MQNNHNLRDIYKRVEKNNDGVVCENYLKFGKKKTISERRAFVNSY